MYCGAKSAAEEKAPTLAEFIAQIQQAEQAFTCQAVFSSLLHATAMCCALHEGQGRGFWCLLLSPWCSRGAFAHWAGVHGRALIFSGSVVSFLHSLASAWGFRACHALIMGVSTISHTRDGELQPLWCTCITPGLAMQSSAETREALRFNQEG